MKANANRSWMISKSVSSYNNREDKVAVVNYVNFKTSFLQLRKIFPMSQP